LPATYRPHIKATSPCHTFTDTYSAAHSSTSYVQKVTFCFAKYHGLPSRPSSDHWTHLATSIPSSPRLSDTLKVPLPYSFCYLQAYWCASGSHENAQGLRSSCMIDFTGSFSFVFLHSFLVSPVLRFRLWFVHGLIGACQRNCGLRRSCFYLGVISHLTIVHFSSAASRMLTGLPISVYGFLFSGVGFCTRHTEPLHATKPSVATSIMPPPEGRLLRSRLLSSILAFRCSRVVINGTRSAMGFALFLSEWWKKYLLLYTVLFGHCFGKREERFA
jgi:hypothetical protein